jgi:hypothetical protein
LHSHQQCIIAISQDIYFATSSTAFVVVIALDSGHSNWGEMKFKCCFDLHLYYNKES